MLNLSPVARRRFERFKKTAVAGGRCGCSSACSC
jgi:hypothetical protein